jgi:hypothetical protein
VRLTKAQILRIELEIWFDHSQLVLNEQIVELDSHKRELEELKEWFLEKGTCFDGSTSPLPSPTEQLSVKVGLLAS